VQERGVNAAQVMHLLVSLDEWACRCACCAPAVAYSALGAGGCQAEADASPRRADPLGFNAWRNLVWFAGLVSFTAGQDLMRDAHCAAPGSRLFGCVRSARFLANGDGLHRMPGHGVAASACCSSDNDSVGIALRCAALRGQRLHVLALCLGPGAGLACRAHRSHATWVAPWTRRRSAAAGAHPRRTKKSAAGAALVAC